MPPVDSTDSRMLVGLSVYCASFPQQACVSQLFAALLNCFGLLFSVLSECPSWPPRGHLLALLLLCSKRLFSILRASIVSWGQTTGPIFSGIEVLTPTEWLTLHHGSAVDSHLLMVFVLWVTWEAPLRKWHSALWWQSRPSPVLHWQGKRPHLIRTESSLLSECPFVTWLQLAYACPQVEKSVSGKTYFWFLGFFFQEYC